LSSVVSKASSGAIEYVPVSRVANITQTINQLKDKGIWIAGTGTEEGKPLHQTDLKVPLAIVIGGEGAGVGRLVAENCDFIVNIPMKGKIQSLNASAAAAIMIYEVVRQRLNIQG
jgi:23S rRNA (guanosine2251-2'-O)-methyltransferase